MPIYLNANYCNNVSPYEPTSVISISGTNPPPAIQLREIPPEYILYIENTKFVNMPGERFSDDLINQIALRNGTLGFEGQALRVMSGKTVFDLGCGTPTISTAVPTLAQQFGARSYVGVEHNLENLYFPGQGYESLLTRDRTFTNTIPPHYAFGERMNLAASSMETQPPSQWFCDNMLGFLAKLPQLNYPAVFVFCGIDPDDSALYFSQYVKAVASELGRLTHSGDVVLISWAFCGGLQSLLEQTGQWEYVTSERRDWSNILLRRI